MEKSAVQESLRFGVFEVDPQARELRKQGIKIKLQDQPFLVLMLLLEQAGAVVTRKDLQTRIWPTSTFVDCDLGLNTAITRLRQALGDTADNPRFIETLPRIGYRFIAPLSSRSTTAEAGSPVRSVPAVDADLLVADRSATTTRLIRTRATTRWVALTVAVFVAVVIISATRVEWQRWLPTRDGPIHIQSIAVLPLENLSRDPEQQYFADGMTDALITDLAQIGSLRVISRTSVMRYKETQKRLPAIAKDLQVDGIVEGTVIRSSDRVRISAQLIQADTDRHVWAGSYERATTDIVAMLHDVAQAIADEIRASLSVQQQARLRRASAVDPRAYDM
jgi:TolB-like protein/DNA-binding winged helix-turn-helix (wHTH) protein